MPTTTTTTTTPLITTIKDTVLVGTPASNIVNVEYSANGASVVNTEVLDSSPVASILYAEKTNKAYVSTSNNLYSYEVSYYVNSSSVSKLLSVSNDDGTIISTYRKADNSLWGVQAYEGKVVRMDPATLSILDTYKEFDSPVKIRYSAFHNAYFVVGSNILWKIDASDVVTPVYEINGYNLKDFDVSESGIICMLFRGTTDDIIRVVSNDLYTLLLNRQVGVGTVSFCKYCNEGKFYILVELSTGVGNSSYSAVHYVFDSKTNVLNSVSSENSLTATTTTTTPGKTTKAVQVTSPVGGESIQLGQQYDIRWISSKGVNEFVKIELYSGTTLYSVLSEKTANTGIFSWNVASDIAEGDYYKVKITWLAASSDSNNYDSSANWFSVLKNVVTTTTTTTTRASEHAIGIDYNVTQDHILIVLSSGNYLIFELSTLLSYGFLALGVSNPITMALRSMVIKGSPRQSKVRIFVGSAMYLSDKWDSGIVETELKSMYYGGGGNLKPGGKYYAHIQTFSEAEGWSELNIKEFVMPK